MSRSIVRQRSENTSEPSTGPCLKASDHEIHKISSCVKIFPPLDLWLQNFVEVEILMVCLCLLKVWFRSDEPILSTTQLKPAFATDIMFAPNGPAFIPGCIITLRAELLLGEQESSASHV